MPGTKNRHRSFTGFRICLVSMAAALALSCCNGATLPTSTPDITAPQGTTLPALQGSSQTPTSSLSVANTEAKTPLASISPISIPSPTDSQKEKIKIDKIVPLPSEDGTVFLAEWSVDGERIDYLLKPYSNAEGQWYEYQVSTHSNQVIDAIIHYDPSIWKSLNLTNPQDEGYDPLVQGYISPSGHNLIAPVNSSSGEFYESENQGPATQIWLITEDGRSRKLLLQPMRGSVSRVYWSPDEKKVIFDVTTFGGDIYVYDLEKQSLTNLSEVSQYQALSSISGWFVSSERDQVAIPTSDALTRIFTLDGKVSREIPEFAVNPTWTPDQKHICYWKDPLLDRVDPRSINQREMALHCYDIQTQKIEQLLNESEIHRLPDYPDSKWKFIISSDLHKIVFYGLENMWVFQME
jgi:hypothetical protein